MRFPGILLIALFVVVSFPPAWSQDLPFSDRFFPDMENNLKKALADLQNGDEFFYSGNTNIYKFAIPHYESADKFNSSNASLNYRLGTCYLMDRKTEPALKHLKKAIELNPEVEPEAYYYLGLTYQKMLKWGEAIAAYFQYGELIRGQEPVDDVSRRIEECRNGKELVKNPVKVTIENLGVTINTRGPEYTPLITADESQLFFTSRRPGTTGNETDNVDLEYFEDIYVSEKVNGRWTLAKNLGSKVNTPMHDAGAGLSSDGHILFVFKGSRNNGDILMSYIEKGEWSVPVDPGKHINTRFHESSACLSPDGNTLYFSSDRPDGYGGRDLYKSPWDPSKKEWGSSVNLGNTINTPLDEEGVFLHPSGNTLYFASKGHNCMGGYDIFYSNLQNNIWQKPINIGYPVNTPDDDVYLVVSADGKTGYYSSVTGDTYGETDIYKVTFLPDADKPVSRMMVLKGIVSDANTKEPIEASIELMDLNKQERIGTFNSDSKTGKYLVSLPSGKKYGAFVYAKGYLFESTYFDIADTSTYSETIYDVALKPVEAGSDVVLSNIFFNTGSAEIRKESEQTLNSLVEILKNYPSLTVEISGHTDNEGDDTSNLLLSENRAKNVVNYLVSKGIDKNRLTYRGFGELRPLVENTSAANKMKNRRIEFRINSK